MSQPSVIQYFNSKKRTAVDEYKLENKSKILKLDQQDANSAIICPPSIKTVSKPPRTFKVSTVDAERTNNQRSVTPPPCQGGDKRTKEVKDVKKLLLQSPTYSKLKQSIDRFKKSAEQLQSVERRIEDLSKSPNLKAFKSLEFEVNLSPQKPQSPEKSYLSPKKEVTSPKNLFSGFRSTRTFSPVAYDTSLPTDDTDKTRTNLQLPFKYRTLMEMFRGLDTVVQLLYNRREVITFKKLKPAIEELVKRTLLPRHVAQIKSVYPEAYDYAQKKVKLYGTGLSHAQWELVLTPLISAESMTTQDLLHRRRKMHQILIDKIKEYHDEFLLSLTPPIAISKDNITHWHPEFDLEKVPEIPPADLPHAPTQQTHTSGKEILESARQLFQCNKRMNQALLNLKATPDKDLQASKETRLQTGSVLKGIPQALLEKVRQKQAAKALVSMTRTADKEKEVHMFSRLPELARLVRNLFVTEKKVVLELGNVVDKLTNSYRTSLSKAEIEDHLKAISSEVPGWLVFHNIRNCVYLKLAKNADLSAVINKLETQARQKSES